MAKEECRQKRPGKVKVLLLFDHYPQYKQKAKPKKLKRMEIK